MASFLTGSPSQTHELACQAAIRLEDARLYGANMNADMILSNGKIATQDERPSFVQAAALKDGRILATGNDQEIMAGKGAATQVIDLGGRTALAGLNDSDLHVIRGGLNYNLELRWNGVPSLADARRTPPGQWIRVVGVWSEFQFAERRMPTLEEINAAAPDTPVFILHLYCQALLNGAALRAVGYGRQTPNPPGGEIQRDKTGLPTGLSIARPNATILYATLARGPKLPAEQQANSTRHFMRELNRLGVTSIIDAGGGFQNYPEDYALINELHRRGEMTVRIAYIESFTRSRTASAAWTRCACTPSAAAGFPARRGEQGRPRSRSACRRRGTLG